MNLTRTTETVAEALEPPPLVIYPTQVEYQLHYEDQYCRSEIYTASGYRVYFPRHQFLDAFFESVDYQARDKSRFAWGRANRIDWIRSGIECPKTTWHVGWNRDKQEINALRCTGVAHGDQIIVLQYNKKKRAFTFVTSYIGDERTIRLITSKPLWAPPEDKKRAGA